MKWEYKTRLIRDGGEKFYDMDEEMNELGSEGWEFCAWVFDWRFSSGPGPDSRVALFRRQAVTEFGSDT